MIYVTLFIQNKNHSGGSRSLLSFVCRLYLICEDFDSKQMQMQVEEVPMHDKCHRKRSSLSVALGLHRIYIYKEVSQKEKFSFCGTWLT